MCDAPCMAGWLVVQPVPDAFQRVSLSDRFVIGEFANLRQFLGYLLRVVGCDPAVT